MPLNDTQVRKLAAKPDDYKKFDGGGLFLLVTSAGGKLWRLKFRVGGKEKLLALGRYPDITLKAAREKRDEARKQLADGIDPTEARKADKAAQAAKALSTFESVTLAWLEHRASAWVPGTQKRIRESLANNVFPTLGGRPIADITPADIRGAVQGIEARGAGETATRVFQRLQSVFRYAVAHELVSTDPTYSLKPAEILKPRKVTHRASIPEREAPAFLRKLDTYDGDPATRSALLLLILTATRPGEIRGAAWSEFDVDAALWTIPAPRMKMR